VDVAVTTIRLERRATRAHARARGAAGALFMGLLAACGGGDATAPGTPSSNQGSAVLTPASVTVVSGGGQSGDPGSALATPLVIQVTTAQGAPVPGVTVGFAVSSGSAAVATASAVTDASGRAQTQVTLGPVAGPVRVTATVLGTSLSTTVAASVAAAATACTATSTIALTPGQVLTPAGTTLCVGGGAAGAEYALVPFNASTSARSRSAFVVRPTNIDPVSSTRLLPSSATATTSADRAAPSPETAGFRGAFEARLRTSAVRALAPRIAGARAWAASRAARPGVRRAVIPGNAAVGQLVTLNANADDPCERPQLRVSRVEAVSRRAIVVADTSNPAGGLTAAEYASIAATFDTLVYDVNVRNFGEPTDLDGNGRVVLYYTSAVNALTPKSSDSFVGGFFTPRDLFPTGDTPALGEGCAGSNVAEMFYLLAPDPGGMVNGNRFSKAFVASGTIATVAHEFEHLINSSRRVYVNTQSEDFEETWLDEGLAHVAEELLFFARSGLAPRQNLDATRLRANASISAAFSDAGIDNFARLDDFLDAPTRNSPYADNDSLATRGATWAFLRYAADQQGAAQETIWRRLVNSNASGMANLQQVFGTGLPALFRDWTTTLLMDDVPGAEARYQFPSWNLRSVMAALDGSGVYPLQNTVLTSGASNTASITGGGAAYMRFAVGAGKTASITWEALPPTITLTLVRLR
jgi:hypothetical protein